MFFIKNTVQAKNKFTKTLLKYIINVNLLKLLITTA